MCNIQSIQITGMNFGSQMLPHILEVSAHVDCYDVLIKIQRNANEDAFEWADGERETVLDDNGNTRRARPGVLPTTPDVHPVDGMPRRLVVHNFPIDPAVDGIKCGDFLHVTVTCAEDDSCKSTALVPVYCKDACPVSIRITADPPFNQAASCISLGTYTVSVLEPLGPNISYSWSLMPVGQPETVMPDTGPNLSVAVPSGNPRMFLTVTATQPNCQPLLSVLVFPPATC